MYCLIIDIIDFCYIFLFAATMKADDLINDSVGLWFVNGQCDFSICKLIWLIVSLVKRMHEANDKFLAFNNHIWRWKNNKQHYTSENHNPCSSPSPSTSQSTLRSSILLRSKIRQCSLWRKNDLPNQAFFFIWFSSSINTLRNIDDDSSRFGMLDIIYISVWNRTACE